MKTKPLKSREEPSPNNSTTGPGVCVERVVLFSKGLILDESHVTFCYILLCYVSGDDDDDDDDGKEKKGKENPVEKKK